MATVLSAFRKAVDMIQAGRHDMHPDIEYRRGEGGRPPEDHRHPRLANPSYSVWDAFHHPSAKAAAPSHPIPIYNDYHQRRLEPCPIPVAEHGPHHRYQHSPPNGVRHYFSPHSPPPPPSSTSSGTGHYPRDYEHRHYTHRPMTQFPDAVSLRRERSRKRNAIAFSPDDMNPLRWQLRLSDESSEFDQANTPSSCERREAFQLALDHLDGRQDKDQDEELGFSDPIQSRNTQIFLVPSTRVSFPSYTTLARTPTDHDTAVSQKRLTLMPPSNATLCL